MKDWMKVFISIALPLTIGGIAGLFTTSEINGWFQTIRKPWWQPPNWVFGPVWTVLYLLMGIAFYLVWKAAVPAAQKRMAITLWLVQLVLNFFWSFIFFKKHQINWALGEIVVLWLFIFLTILSFGRIRKTAAWLMVPYISWVSFAALLTLTIYQLNPASPNPSGGGASPSRPSRWEGHLPHEGSLKYESFFVQCCSER